MILKPFEGKIANPPFSPISRSVTFLVKTENLPFSTKYFSPLHSSGFPQPLRQKIYICPLCGKVLHNFHRVFHRFFEIPQEFPTSSVENSVGK